jgi:hypothetical protein
MLICLAAVILAAVCVLYALPQAEARADIPAESIVISGSREVAVGKTVRLSAEVSPDGADQDVRWKSSDESIATVSSSGKVRGIAAGKVKITAVSRADKSVRKSVTVTVREKAVRKITISAETQELYLNGSPGTVTLRAEASPASASQAFTWKSSDPKVAKVSRKGKVTAVGAGSAKITATAADGSGVSRKITITVKRKAPSCYALLIGNGYGYTADFTGQLKDSPYNLRAMKGLLKGLKTSWHITVKSDLAANEIISAIHSAYAKAEEGDICLFFYSGHGVSDEEAPAIYDSEQGGLIGVDDEVVTGTRLANALKNTCPGKVIVILDSCGSGSLVHKKNGAGADPAAGARQFTQQMNDAFARADSLAGNSGTGALRNGRFVVLTACAYRELGALNPMEGFDVTISIFMYHLIHAAGCDYPSGKYSGHMPADTDGDGCLTLQEAYAWVREKVVADSDDTQHVSNYGDGSYVLFSH